MIRNLFKKSISIFVFLLMAQLPLNAQVTTNGGSGLAATYTSLDAAITALNAATITSPVIITLAASNAQTAPAGGYIISAEGSAANTIRLVGNNNTITASNALTAGNLNDGIFKIIGGDYISIENFTMLENPANIIVDAATNNMTEWGVALLYTSTTNGSQNNTIKGCTIDLNRNYQNTFGIYSNSNHSATSVATAAPAPTATGGNSGLTIISNTVTDVNVGIVVIGPTPASAENDGLIIGGSLANANTISNYGTTGTFSGYANVSGTVNGILIRCVKNLTVSYNTISSSDGGTIAGSLRGIYLPSVTNLPVGIITNNITNNTISLKSAVLAGAIQGISVEGTTANITTTLNINNNNFTTLNHTIAAASGAITGIINLAIPLTLSISGNIFTSLSCNTTGSFTFLSLSNIVTLPVGGSQTISSNSIVTSFSKTGDGGTVTLFTTTSNSPSGTTSTSSNNNFSNITVTGATIIAGWVNRDGASTISGPNKTISNNTFNNWVGGTGAVTALTINASAAGSVHTGNVVSTISGGGTVTGVSILTNESGNFSGNTINGLSSSGASVVTGISLSGTASSNAPLVSKNKIYTLVTNNSAGSVNGVLISYLGTGVVATIANNLIGDLKAPTANNDVTDAIRGINITSTATTANFNVYFNTVYLNASSTGTHFGTASIFHTQSATATTAVLDLRNNILINTSTASGLGTTAAFRRSATGQDNFSSTSNNNIFYAGIPSSINAIYHNGTAYNTLTDYKTLVTPREAASKTENTPFTSTVGSNAGFLHVSTTTPTLAESGAVSIAGITDDYDGNTRASTPDIGADEFIGIALPVTLVIFTGSKQTLGNQLLWATATETNNMGFELLRSADGTNFSKLFFIASKAANGNASSNSTYEFIDQLPLNSANYYRLKQMDRDGKTTLSNIVLLKGNKPSKLAITTMYPNPATDQLNLIVASSLANKITIIVTDFAGHILLRQQATIVNGEQPIQLNVMALAKGNYTIQAINENNETAVSRFIKL